ncbi:hypothetical protein [Vitiosangium sp. GDMCC 1.1324]|uniref:hypothetical protein n=1 Tax=Vitiosangium sp. (strain GDMCC 1.1324) TaxID=2138576 RepID=UPI0011B39525|nr:hypothetical protein [Vitiosangium sp. GDMCC 1.1324]
MRTSSPGDEDLASRILGQVSDLPVVLRVSPGPSLGGNDGEQWRTAVELAESLQARVVLWFDREPEAIVLHLAEPATRRLFVRRIQSDERRETLGRSASAEAAALVVRSALKALEAGSQLGEPVVPEPRVEPVVTPPPPPVVVPPPEPPAPTEGWQLGVGWQAAVDGHSPRGQQGPQVAVGWEGRGLRARVLLLASLPARLSDAYTRVTLSRHAAGVAGDAALVSSARFRLGVGLGAGVAGFLRSTEPLQPEVEASPSRLIPALYVAPELSARWRGGPMALEASVGADVLAGVPTLGYHRDGTFIVRNRLWVVQPRFSLSVVLGSR